MKNIEICGLRREGVRTTGFIAEFTADFHFCREGDDGNSDFVLNTCLKCVVDVSWIACGQRPKYNEDFPGRVSRKVTRLGKSAVEEPWKRLAADLMLLLAISMEFCKLGSPLGSSL